MAFAFPQDDLLINNVRFSRAHTHIASVITYINYFQEIIGLSLRDLVIFHRTVGSIVNLQFQYMSDFCLYTEKHLTILTRLFVYDRNEFRAFAFYFAIM